MHTRVWTNHHLFVRRPWFVSLHPVLKLSLTNESKAHREGERETTSSNFDPSPPHIHTQSRARDTLAGREKNQEGKRNESMNMPKKQNMNERSNGKKNEAAQKRRRIRRIRIRRMREKSFQCIRSVVDDCGSVAHSFRFFLLLSCPSPGSRS